MLVPLRSIAEEKKTAKCILLPDTITFQPVAFETLGPINQTGVEFLAELGHRLEIISHDARERSFLFQRLSLTVQRSAAQSHSEAALLTNMTLSQSSICF